MSDRYTRLKEELTKPEFNPSYVPIVLDENTIHVRAGPHGGTTLTVSDNDETATLKRVVSLIDGTNSFDDILARFDSEMHDEILDFFEYLSEKNVIRDAGDEPRTALSDYSAVKPIGSRKSDWTESDADILIYSVGKIGQYVAEELHSMGITPIRYFSQTHPEPPFTETDGIELIQPDERESVIETVDALVFLTDRPAPAIATNINEITHRTNTPWIVGQIQGFDGFVGPMIFPGKTACYNCFQTRTFSNVDDEAGYRAYLQQAGLDDDGPVIPFMSQVVSGYVGLDLLNLISFGQGFTAGRVIHFDGLDLTVSVDDVLRVPRCTVCGKDTVDESRFVSNLDTVVEHIESEDDKQ